MHKAQSLPSPPSSRSLIIRLGDTPPEDNLTETRGVGEHNGIFPALAAANAKIYILGEKVYFLNKRQLYIRIYSK